MSQVHNLVRGMLGPYPAAFTYRGDTKIEIDRTELLEETITGIPGQGAAKTRQWSCCACQEQGFGYQRN